MHIGIKLAILLLPGLTPIAWAQDVSSPFDRIQGCDRENSSHLLPGFDCREFSRSALTYDTAAEKPIVIKTPQAGLLNCEAEISLEYEQRGAIARVEGQIENKTCGASSGNYVLSVRTRNSNSELQTQDFPQTWQRDDDQPVPFAEDFPIGENVDLVRVTALRLSCKCAEKE